MALRKKNLGALITAGALDAARDTGLIDVSEATKLVLEVDLTRGGTLTALVLTLEESHDDGATWNPVMVESTGALAPFSWTRTTSVSERMGIVLDIEAFDAVRATFTGTGSTASDTIDVRAIRTSP